MTFQFLQSMTIARKLAVLIISSIIGIVTLTSLFLVSERTLILEERQANVRQAVETAHGILVHFQAQAQSGALPQAEAQKKAIDAIKSLRYSGSEYFWINDMHPKMIMHPIKPALDNTDLTANTDPTGKHLFVEFVNAVKSGAGGAGFVFYMWPKPGSDAPVQKVSYVKGFAPWGWIIGSGVYIDTVEATVRSRMISFSIGALALAGVLLGIGLLIGRGMLRQLGGEPTYAADIARQIAEGDLSTRIELAQNDQSSLLHGIRTMRDDLAKIVTQVRTGTDSIATCLLYTSPSPRD